MSCLEETPWLLELSAPHDFIRGVVGWPDWTDPRVGATVDDWQPHANLKLRRAHLLPATAEVAGYDVVLMVEQGIPHQQFVAGRRLSIVLVRLEPISSKTYCRW
jgi:hypothetical protein